MSKQMLNTLGVSRAQVARLSNSVAALSVLADRIRAEHAAVVSAFSSPIQDALAAGRALIEAEDLIGHGRWTRFFKDCDLGERQAERYAQLARLYDSNPSSGTDLAGLSIPAAIKKLSPPKSSDKELPAPKTSETRCRPRPTPTQEKLSSLTWADASPTERARFVSAIDWPSVAEAMRVAWLPVIQEWLRARLSKDAAPTIDRDGNVLPDDLSIPTFLRRNLSANSEAAS